MISNYLAKHVHNCHNKYTGMFHLHMFIKTKHIITIKNVDIQDLWLPTQSAWVFRYDRTARSLTLIQFLDFEPGLVW